MSRLPCCGRFLSTWRFRRRGSTAAIAKHLWQGLRAERDGLVDLYLLRRAVPAPLLPLLPSLRARFWQWYRGLSPGQQLRRADRAGAGGVGSDFCLRRADVRLPDVGVGLILVI